MNNRFRVFPFLAVGLLATAGLTMAQDTPPDQVHPWRNATNADQTAPAIQDQQQNQYPVQNGPAQNAPGFAQAPYPAQNGPGNYNQAPYPPQNGPGNYNQAPYPPQSYPQQGYPCVYPQQAPSQSGSAAPNSGAPDPQARHIRHGAYQSVVVFRQEQDRRCVFGDPCAAGHRRRSCSGRGRPDRWRPDNGSAEGRARRRHVPAWHSTNGSDSGRRSDVARSVAND